jgi:hypothetical protein
VGSSSGRDHDRDRADESDFPSLQDDLLVVHLRSWTCLRSLRFTGGARSVMAITDCRYLSDRTRVPRLIAIGSIGAFNRDSS